MKFDTSKMPQWKCVREVRASQIVDIRGTPTGNLITLDCGTEVDMPDHWMIAVVPRVGGYLVAHEDGRVEFMHRGPFQNDFLKVPPTPTQGEHHE